MLVQRNWLYLETIFSAADIQRSEFLLQFSFVTSVYSMYFENSMDVHSCMRFEVGMSPTLEKNPNSFAVSFRSHLRFYVRISFVISFTISFRFHFDLI